MKEFNGIILAGGKSSRMGQDKALMKMNGKTFLEKAIETLSSVCKKVLVVRNTDNPEYPHVTYVKDIYQDKGPMAGLHSGLIHSDQRFNLVIPCDSPLIDINLVNFLISEYNDESALISLDVKGKIHPLIGIYSKDILPEAESLILDNKLKMKNLLDKAKAKYSSIPESLNEQLLNINQQEDLNLI